MRRSLLFIPGNNPAMLQNADVFGADAVIFDLEDAVSPTEKDSARNLMKCYLETSSNPPMEIVVRINGLDTPYYLEDLEAIVSDHIDTIMLPKARINYLKDLDKLLTEIEKKKKLKKHIGVIPIIELAISVIEVDVIASLPRVNGILLGAEDLSSDMEVVRTKEGVEIEYARNRVATACKAYEIDAIDTPFTDVNDYEGLKKDASHAYAIGMNAKSCIHPNQLDTVNKIFLPTEKQINWALRVHKATEEAKQKGLGVFSLDGKMVDKPVMERAEKILLKARKFGVIDE